MTTLTRKPATVSDQLMRKIFSGQIRPGAKLVERQLACELGVSRVPVRETLMRMVAQGALVGGEKGQGVRMREYTPREVRQLYQLREMIEGGVARAAAQARTEDDLMLLEALCERMEPEVDRHNLQRWAELDHKYHDAFAAASHQERFIHAMKTLLAEAHYVFFLFGSSRCPQAAEDAQDQELAASRRGTMREHRTLLALIRQGDADAAERAAREHMRRSGDRATRALIADLNASSPS